MFFSYELQSPSFGAGPTEFHNDGRRIESYTFLQQNSISKLIWTISDFKENPAGEEITQEFNFIQQLLSLKLQTLSDLNENILETLSEEDIESEIPNTDEYMYE